MPVDGIYQLIMGCAIAAGWWISRRTQAQIAIKSWQRYGLLFGAFCGAMIGAKLPFVFVDWDAFLSGAAWFQNGKTILFGLVGGYIGVELAKWAFDIHVRTGDSFAVPVAVTIAIGRLGCFWAGCCYGKPTDVAWAAVFPSVDSLPRHPAQIYESAFHLTAAGILVAAQRDGIAKGHLIKIYIVAYAVFRFFSEFYRDEPIVALNMTLYQGLAIFIATLFGIIWYRDARRGAS
ncbi:MAG: prolipoprotein diacylglyceryl transferase family protein [Planctomycetota bacterium]